jgi:hypothetical protein
VKVEVGKIKKYIWIFHIALLGMSTALFFGLIPITYGSDLLYIFVLSTQFMFCRLTQTSGEFIMYWLFVPLFLSVIFLLPQWILWALVRKKWILLAIVLSVLILDTGIILIHGQYVRYCHSCLPTRSELPMKTSLFLERCGDPLFYRHNSRTDENGIVGIYTNGFDERHYIFLDNGMTDIYAVGILWND